MKIEDFKNIAKLIRSNAVYNVYDLKTLKNLTLSLTELNVGQTTKGHQHDADEVYFFFSGEGQIMIGADVVSCEGGDVFLIPRNSFHKVFNLGEEPLKFWCVFENYDNR